MAKFIGPRPIRPFKYLLLCALALAGCDSTPNLEKLQREAAAGNAEAKSKLASFYENLQREADAGNVEAQFKLASYYRQGLGVEPDLAKARELFTRAAQAGNHDAQVNLALFYKKG